MRYEYRIIDDETGECVAFYIAPVESSLCGSEITTHGYHLEQHEVEEIRDAIKEKG